MKKSKPLNLAFWAFLSLILVSGCYYDKEEDLYPQQSQCDTSNVTYSSVIATIIQTNCNVCHSTAVASGGFITDNYSGLSALALNGKLGGAVNWDQGFSAMPKSSSKLSDCDLRKINKWINAGAPNN